MINYSSAIFLEVQDASFYYKQQVLFEHINWTIRNEEHWAIVGGVGAGKTSLLNAILGKYIVRHGKITYSFLEKYRQTPDAFVPISDYVAVVSFGEASAAFSYANYYYQQRFNAAYAEGILTAETFLKSAATQHCTPDEFEKICRLLDIQEVLPLEFIKLSNGQTRKVRIAKALLAKPELLILDNPFIGLDTGTRENLNKIINELIIHGTKVILTATHTDLPEQITHVLQLDNFQIRGLYTRDDFLRRAESAEKRKEALPEKTITLSPKKEPAFTIAFQFKEVTVRYGEKVALQDINWTVHTGEKWALLGPNGSGKSTLLSLINADHPQAYANDIMLFDQQRGSGESIWDIKQKIGFVSPELHLYFHQNLLCREVAATGFFDTLYVNKSVTSLQKKIIDTHFAYFHMEHLLEKNFGQLSTGEQRLVLLIRSLVKHPDVIIWDEPFQGLDEHYIRLATKLLALYCHSSTTLMFVTHYAHEIPAFVNKYLHLDNGRISKIERR